ncbi:hypothetical protein [Candidatus Thiothrix anitrata]|nr:hypothetical protein [Candidatus Thiothrix anitrata]
MYAMKWLALALALSAVVTLGACSKAESVSGNNTAAAATQGQ